MSMPTEQSRCFDNTKLSGYKNCPRYHFLRQVLGWKRVGTGSALVFGSSWHEGMDAVWTHAKNVQPDELAKMAYLSFIQKWEEEGYNPEPGLQEQEQLGARTPMVAYEMYVEYINARWKMLQEANVLAVEQPVAVPIPGMDNFWYVGRLDKVIQYGANILVLEHKSTTAYATIGNFRTDYVESWYTDSQVKGYEFLASLYYPGLDAVWVDAALVHKKIHNAFKFIPVNHSQDLMLEWVNDMAAWTARVALEEDKFKDAGYLTPGLFPKNENSCFGKYGACTFIDVCRSVADPSKLDEIPAGYIVEPWNPFSMIQLDKVINEPGE